MTHKPPFQRRFLAPRHWPIWLCLGLLRLVVVLPQKQRMAVGRGIGWLFFQLGKKRRAIAEINLKACFPHWSEQQRQQVLRDHFRSLGMAVVETGMAWWLPGERLMTLHRSEGLEYLHQARQQGQGVLLLSAHFVSLELGNRMLALHVDEPVSMMYQRHKHPIMEWIIQHNRGPHAQMIPENDVRQLIRALRAKKVVWYAADQAYGHDKRNAALVPFCGEPAASNTALSRIARQGDVAVIPFFVQRDADARGYLLRLMPPLQDFPGEDAVADTLRYHQLIEQQIARAPGQYLWVHRRFKSRPPELPDLYRDL